MNYRDGESKVICTDLLVKHRSNTFYIPVTWSESTSLSSHLVTGGSSGEINDVAEIRRRVFPLVKLKYFSKRVFSTLHRGGCHLAHDVT